jgi:hypothetical protein
MAPSKKTISSFLSVMSWLTAYKLKVPAMFHQFLNRDHFPVFGASGKKEMK